MCGHPSAPIVHIIWEGQPRHILDSNSLFVESEFFVFCYFVSLIVLLSSYCLDVYSIPYYSANLLVSCSERFELKLI